MEWCHCGVLSHVSHAFVHARNSCRKTIVNPDWRTIDALNIRSDSDFPVMCVSPTRHVCTALRKQETRIAFY